MNWQPIETAPKGPWIIAFDGLIVQPVKWADDDITSPYKGWAYATHDWGGVLYEGFNEVKIQPTHWMPLPDAP